MLRRLDDVRRIARGLLVKRRGTKRSRLLARRATWGVVAAGVSVAGSLALPRGLPVEAVIPGLVIGGLSAFTAVGIVLIYRSSRIINFAQANMGGMVAVTVVLLVTARHWNYGLALLAGIALAALVGAIVERGLLGPLHNAPRLILTVGTIGVAELFGAAALFLPSLLHAPTRFSTVVPFHAPVTEHLTVGTLVVSGDYFLAILAIPIVLIALVWYLNRTDFGIGARAAADSSERAHLLGIPVRRLSLATWVIASTLSALGATLLAGVNGYQPSVLAGPESLVIPLVAAVIAGFDSLVVAFLASVAIGVAQQAIYWSYRRSSLVDLIMFGLMLVALLLQRQPARRVGGEDLGGFVAVREPKPLPMHLQTAPGVRRLRASCLAVVVASAALIPLALNNAQLTFAAFVAIFVIVAASLVVLTGWGGQVSLGQFGIVGLGAGTTAWLLTSYRASLLLCLACSVLVGLASALIIGLPALRISGVNLAAVTLAFAVPASTFFLDSTRFPSFAPASVQPPLLFGRFDLTQSRDFYYLCLVAALAALGLARNFRTSRVGRTAVAVRDNERLAASFAISPTRARLTAFGLSGALAGLAGGLYVLAYRGVPFGGFSPVLSLQAFTMVVVGGMASLWGAVLGALYVYLGQYFLGGIGQLLMNGAGVLLILYLAPGGLADLSYRARDFVVRLLYSHTDRSAEQEGGSAARRTTSSRVSTALRLSAAWSRAVAGVPRFGRQEETHAAGVASPTTPKGPLLVCESMSANYGHLRTLVDVDLAVEDGEVFALLGTNGAGKSTALRVLAGLHHPRTGDISFDGQSLVGFSVQDRVRRGIVLVPGGRGVFGSLSVHDNLRLAAWTARRRGDHDFIDTTTSRILRLFPPLHERLGQKAALLSGGEQQMLTIAQALLCRPRLLMIDELSLGLAPAVVSSLLDVLREINADGTTVIIVEQSLVTAASIAPRAAFLEKGQVRFVGPTTQLALDGTLARSVFLGEPAERSQSGRSTDGAVPSRDISSRPAVALEACGITKTYGGIAALTNVDLTIPCGHIVGIIGANGAGKTTLFDVVSGFVHPDAGTIRFQGRDITGMSPAERATIGLGRTFQDLRLFPSLTVREALAVALERHIEVREPIATVLGLPATLRSEAQVKEKVAELAHAFGLERYADSPISELSTGTRRIVELACSSAHEPSLLILDEPASGLAQREAEAMVPMLHDLRRRTGATIAIIEHDIPLVRTVADHVVCMHLGEVLAGGDPEQVLSDPAVIHAYLGGSLEPERRRRRRTSVGNPVSGAG